MLLRAQTNASIPNAGYPHKPNSLFDSGHGQNLRIAYFRIALLNRCMRLFNCIATIILFSATLSCGNEKDPEPIIEPEPVPVLTIDASAYPLLPGEESWLFIADSAGKILETKPLTGGQILKFTATTRNDSITLVRVHHYAADQVQIDIYGGIKTQTTLKFAYVDSSIPPGPAFTGNATVKVTNYPSVGDNQLVLSSSGIFDNVTGTEGEVNFDFPIYGDNIPILLSAFTADGVPVYKWTASASAGQTVQEDFSAFGPYPLTIQLPLRDNLRFLLLTGYNSDWENHGTAFAYNQWYNTAPPAAIGYLPGYKGYSTEITFVDPAASFTYVSYRKRGTIPSPSQLELPFFSYAIKNASVKSAEFSIDRGYTYKHAFWHYGPPGSTDVLCNLYAPKSFKTKLTTLPPEILEKYPQLGLDDLVLGNCEFVEHLDGYTYEQAINDLLQHHSHLATYEYRVYGFQP
jgi:hypothetical protein